MIIISQTVYHVRCRKAVLREYAMYLINFFNKGEGRPFMVRQNMRFMLILTEDYFLTQNLVLPKLIDLE